MKLGFVSAIFPDLSLEEVVRFAAAEGFETVEVMCWPKGKAERRYAGVTHVDVVGLTRETAQELNGKLKQAGIEISGLGYYPNPLTPDDAEAELYAEHIRKVIQAARLLGVPLVNSFIGRDWTRTIDENWPRFRAVWEPLIRFAEDQDVRIAIENCPMYFSGDEWPGGKNLAFSPKIWRRMFDEIPSDHFGLNCDPSHLVWLRIDYLWALREFGPKIFHVHAKDVRIDTDRLNEVGILATPLEFHTPKLPGLGEVDWGKFVSVLGETGYRGPVCVEVEDRAYEGSLADRKASLRQSHDFLRQFIARRKESL